ncbi:GGDEF domain-containing protein [Mycetohabitans sp. B46]|uniref:GGDEF domain-containing protein n=1 Tax=Mycetohabitans sp. B46 TaxID=2772536 RepID=UPI003FD01631
MLGVQLCRRLRAELERLVRTDGLTGLSNRRTLSEILDIEWRRARRNRSVLSLLFVGTDRSKTYNEFMGTRLGTPPAHAGTAADERSIPAPRRPAAPQ